jgi:hypothetical protein
MEPTWEDSREHEKTLRQNLGQKAMEGADLFTARFERRFPTAIEVQYSP